MSLSADNNEQQIKIRIQELDLGADRPYEEDLMESGLYADSIGDLPVVGDSLVLRVDRMNSEREFIKKIIAFKVISRLIDFQFLESSTKSILCNIVVQEIPSNEVGKLIKD